MVRVFRSNVRRELMRLQRVYFLEAVSAAVHYG